MKVMVTFWQISKTKIQRASPEAQNWVSGEASLNFSFGF